MTKIKVIKEEIQKNKYNLLGRTLPISIIMLHLTHGSHKTLWSKTLSQTNVVLITSTVQVELSKLNLNFDGITNFLQVLTYYGFSRLLCYA